MCVYYTSDMLSLCVCFVLAARGMRMKEGSRSEGGSGPMMWKKYRVGEVVLVIKIHVYSLSLMPFEWRCVGLRMNHSTCNFSCCAAIMTGSSTANASTYQQTPHPTWRNTNTGLRTWGHCPSRVSDVAIKWHWCIGVVLGFVLGKAMVKYDKGIHTLPYVLTY